MNLEDALNELIVVLVSAIVTALIAWLKERSEKD